MGAVGQELTVEAPQTAAYPSIPSAASGKLYDWSLPSQERPSLVALPRGAMAERTDEETLAVFQASIVRVSALLTVLSSNNGYEGRNRAVISDDLSCGTVAGMLGIDIDMLQRVLVELQSRGFVSATESGELLLSNIAALEQLSDIDLDSATATV